MLNSVNLSLVNKIGDKTEFTITRVHCTALEYSKFAAIDTENVHRGFTGFP